MMSPSVMDEAAVRVWPAAAIQSRAPAASHKGGERRITKQSRIAGNQINAK
jgi:hypothetical protein